MCMVDYGGTGSWLQEPHEVRARKDHRCDNCWRQIVKGESHHTGVWKESGEDGLLAFRYCVFCVTAGWWLDRVCGGHLWGGTAISDDLSEHWLEETQFRCRSFALLLAAMGRRWEGTSLKNVQSLTKYATAHALREIEKAAA
jgi:hypothetical protein